MPSLSQSINTRQFLGPKDSTGTARIYIQEQDPAFPYFLRVLTASEDEHSGESRGASGTIGPSVVQADKTIPEEVEHRAEDYFGDKGEQKTKSRPSKKLARPRVILSLGEYTTQALPITKT